MNGVHFLFSVVNNNNNHNSKRESVHPLVAWVCAPLLAPSIVAFSVQGCVPFRLSSQSSHPNLCCLQLAFNSWVSVSVSLFTKVAENSIFPCLPLSQKTENRVRDHLKMIQNPYKHLPPPPFLRLPPPSTALALCFCFIHWGCWNKYKYMNLVINVKHKQGCSFAVTLKQEQTCKWAAAAAATNMWTNWFSEKQPVYTLCDGRYEIFT